MFVNQACKTYDLLNDVDVNSKADDFRKIK